MSRLIGKPLVWVGSSGRDLKAMPEALRRAFGLGLFAAQCGEMPNNAKAMKGFRGAGVIELIEDHRSGTYRAVYTVSCETAIFVLHAFQKKSKCGVSTPVAEVDLIGLARAYEIEATRMSEQPTRKACQ